MGYINGPRLVTSGLILYLDATNEKSYTSGSTAWNDLSGNGYSGTLTNNPTFDSSNGGSIGFNGSTQYAITSNRITQMEFQYTDAFTVCSMCYIKENSGDGYIINNRMTDGNGNPYCGWAILQNSGKLLGVVGGYPGGFSWRRAETTTTIFNSLVFNKWAHITYLNTGTAGQQKIYINGVDYTSVATDDSNPPYTINYSNGNSRINVGRDGTVTHYLNAQITNVSVYNRTLSPSEIQQNYELLRGRYGL